MSSSVNITQSVYDENEYIVIVDHGKRREHYTMSAEQLEMLRKLLNYRYENPSS